MSPVFNTIEVAGLVLNVALLLFLLSERFHRFLVLTAYAAGRLLANVAEFIASHKFGHNAAQYARVYWPSEVLMNALLFLMVIVFTYQCLEGNEVRATARRFLTGIVAVAIVAPFVIYHQRTMFSTRWFNGLIQWFNFGGAIMNLGLWTALLANKKRDPQLVMVSIGLGLAVTGAAMGFGLRQFTSASSGAREFANLVVVLTHVLGLFVWCWAFRPAFMRNGGPKQPQPAATSSGY